MKPVGEVKDAGFGLGALGFLTTPLPIGMQLYTADQLRQAKVDVLREAAKRVLAPCARSLIHMADEIGKGE